MPLVMDRISTFFHRPLGFAAGSSGSAPYDAAVGLLGMGS